MASDSQVLTGGCLCRATRYLVKGTPFNSAICYCTHCRGVSGAASVAWFSVQASEFDWVDSSKLRVFASSPGVERTFCGDCGTPLTYQTEKAKDEIDVTTCSLDEPDRVPPVDQVYVRSNVSWVKLDPDLKVFQKERGNG